MSAKRVMNKLKILDAYPKTLDDFRIKTFSGAAISVISGILMLVLFLSELKFYLMNEVQPELFVDISKGQKLKININITFHRIGCRLITIDAMDVSGDQQIDLEHNIFKVRLDQLGEVIDDVPLKQDLGGKSQNRSLVPATTLDPNRCESCYGAETLSLKCCNTCEQVKEAYRRKKWAVPLSLDIEQCNREEDGKMSSEDLDEGCKIYGYLEVNKVAGNFHIAPGHSFSQNHIHVHDMQSLSGKKVNVSHTIEHLSFGRDYPGQTNPLDGYEFISEEGSVMQHYFVKIVPTTYLKITQETIYTNQYSVTKHSKPVTGGLFSDASLPGAFFTYELSPMMVKYTEKRRSFMHFLTEICAIIGGMFTVAGLLDALLYHSSRAIQRKFEMGKVL